MSYLDLLREEFPENPSPRELQKLQKAPSDNPSELQKLQEAPFYSFYSSHSRMVSEIKPAVAAEAKLPLSPELELLVRKAAVHYECPPDELPLMLEEARNDPENALTYYRSLAAELDLVPDPAVEARREKVLDMLEQNPSIKHALTTDTKSDPQDVIITVGIRNLGTAELRIPMAKYDPFAIMKAVETLQ